MSFRTATNKSHQSMKLHSFELCMANENEKKRWNGIRAASINVFRKTDKTHLHFYSSHSAIFLSDDNFRPVEISSDSMSKKPRWIRVDTNIRIDPIVRIIIANCPSDAQGRTNKTAFFAHKYWRCYWSDVAIKLRSSATHSRWRAGFVCSTN